ncbi:TIGR03557 family F420-dependent LLM class oxidoreductase [Streptomyces sp. AV19]|uniref:TIGR03557 family F420-dependent LLM class oxidoreductase n=1 Tax=Streptomyces sp. AV19 TaxID=2793068 RepID=UPI0018FE9BA5|nr:TIGR03557 family F420-dependent LLM class oxidoreductase [Streptomyces sp. AV19]MBH1937728.1 TIGR03557 family F420-dependent LLM class oxidoreductase [Streptomyces sp. AV19]MDG4536396.1 TIGR03557 family F420-dependent LLM class oxidoreductase [Streptomyces sp. AV19]
MARIGYTMMTEQAGPRELVEHVVGAEEAGFGFSVIPDHYFPWLASQGHAPHAWAVLGAAAQATSRIPLMTYVTCPTTRYHPVVVAQQAATVQLLSQGRFRLGLGSGENLNEHVVGGGWPSPVVRFRWFGLGWQVNAELPHDGSFAAASRSVSKDEVAGGIPCGDRVEDFVAAVRPYAEAGFDEIALVQIGGGRQEPFLNWARNELLPALREL